MAQADEREIQDPEQGFIGAVIGSAEVRSSATSPNGVMLLAVAQKIGEPRRKHGRKLLDTVAAVTYLGTCHVTRSSRPVIP